MLRRGRYSRAGRSGYDMAKDDKDDKDDTIMTPIKDDKYGARGGR